MMASEHHQGATHGAAIEGPSAAADRDRFFNMSLDLLCVAGLDGYFKTINPSFSRVLGYDDAELLARPFTDFVHPDDLAATAGAMAKLDLGEDVFNFENRYRCKDGSYRVLEWRASWDAGAQQIVAIARDVTQQRALQGQLLQSQKMEAVGQLAGGVAHDFNNLMLAITANANFAQEVVGDDSEVGEYLHEISRAAQRAADLTRQLLAMSRQRPTKQDTVDVNGAITELERMLRRLIPESIEIEFVPGPELPCIEGDAAQLEQVVLNLCLNARDAMRVGGRIGIETKEELVEGRSFVVISVSDTGHGMAPEVRDRVFEPFFTTKKQGEGTGLGLSTVYGIVEQHHGEIHIDSELGGGTTFEVYIPSVERRVATPVAKPSLEVIGGDETILVAEDEELVRNIVIKMLCRAGYEVLTAVDGAAALRLFEARGDEVSLALVDMVMPGISGPNLYAAMCKLSPELPVVFTSGYNDPSRFSDVLPEGTVVLDKPYEERELLRRVRHALDEGTSKST